MYLNRYPHPPCAVREDCVSAFMHKKTRAPFEEFTTPSELCFPVTCRTGSLTFRPLEALRSTRHLIDPMAEICGPARRGRSAGRLVGHLGHTRPMVDGSRLAGLQPVGRPPAWVTVTRDHRLGRSPGSWTGAKTQPRPSPPPLAPDT